MLEVYNRDGKLYELMTSNDFIVKTYKVSGITFKENSMTKIGNPSDIGCNESKLIIPFMLGRFVSTPSYDIIDCFLMWKYNGIFLYTNKTQELQFEIIWVEKL